MRLLVVSFLFLTGLSSGCGGPTDYSLNDKAARTVEAALEAPDARDRIKIDVDYLAADDLEGREAGGSGYMEAARYVAARFQGLGLDRGAGGAWFQTVPLKVVRRDLNAARLEIYRADGARTVLRHLEDYLVGRPIGSSSFDVTAGAVFAGYGVVDEASGYDDYRGLDVDGKIAVILSGAPPAFDGEKRAFHASIAQKHRNAKARGAVAILTVLTISDEKRRPWSRRVSRPQASGMTWLGADGAPGRAAHLLAAHAMLNVEAARILFADAPLGFDEIRARQDLHGSVAGFDLNARLSLAGAVHVERTESPNVVAVIEGGDSRLKNEVILVTAHLDHVGVSKSAGPGDDAINNGALDNAMGVAIMLEVARRLKASTPRRTIMFAALTGEEKGLIGADYLARFPPVEDKRLVGNINLDMPLLLYPFTDVIAFGAEQSTIGETVKRAAGDVGVSVVPDPMPEEGIFTRSDHFRFVEQGIPAVYLITGFSNGGGEAFRNFLSAHYHKPSDAPGLPINYDAAARFADLNSRIVNDLASADAPPRWRSGKFFAERFGRPAAHSPDFVD